MGLVQAVERVAPTMTPAEFGRKWGPGGAADGLNERAGAQPHFIDLCAMLGVRSPADPDNYCFERGLWGASGGHRFADVWMRGHFGWEYKAPGGNLSKALDQLMLYALPLENPPLLIVSDRHSIQIHTHFTGHPSEKLALSHSDLRDPGKQALLRSAFLSPDDFRPNRTKEQVTQELAGSFARIADALRARGETPFRAAHFLTQCIFCCFAESVAVLPDQVFRRVVQKRQPPLNLQRALISLFTAMHKGGDFGADTIPWFNGGLFNQIDVPLLTHEEIALLAEVAETSWAAIDPSILGTLFERGLDPEKRRQMGAHYTDAATIERLIDPVVRRPLLAEWEEIRRSIAGLMSKRDVLAVRAKGIPSRSPTLKARHGGVRSQSNRAQKQAEDLQSAFMDRLQAFRVLDPACGSGNFLFLALKALKDIEHQVNLDSEELGLERQIPVTGPQNVLGIEINEYAAELARATVWIGELQWRKEHGYGWKENPILDPLDHIECRDAVLTQSCCEAPWPFADVVVSNPPFLGDKKMRGALGTAYTKALRSAYTGRVAGGGDLVCYWFEKARTQIEHGLLKRAGLVSTNSIRGGRSRATLDRVCKTTRIFSAWSDEAWINDGAAVRVSMIGFGTGVDGAVLDGERVPTIPADLSHLNPGAERVDLTKALVLSENAETSFSGIQKTGPFEVPGDVARAWLNLPNPHGKPNSDVVRPWLNGLDITRRPRDMWICDFGTSMTYENAALFELPFAHVTKFVRPTRVGKREARTNERYWLFQWSRPAMRQATAGLPRLLVTLEVGKFRTFSWIDASCIADKNLVVIARSDDTSFGILHSRFHELWSLHTCTWMGKGNDPRYTPTSCFDTFPFPEGLTPADTSHKRTKRMPDHTVIPADLSEAARESAVAVAQAAKCLTDLRHRWLNPPEWCETVPEVIPLGLKSSPYPNRIVAKPGFEKELAKRTLTNLYNERPSWLTRAHNHLDTAVAAAYGWADYTPAMSDEEVLRRLLALNVERARLQSGQGELPLVALVSGRPSQMKTEKVAGRQSRRAA